MEKFAVLMFLGFKMDGSVFQLYKGVVGPIDRYLDYLFYAGTLYGTWAVARLSVGALKGLGTYFLSLGRVKEEDLGEKYGKWAVITGGTSGIGLAYAHEVRISIICISLTCC